MKVTFPVPHVGAVITQSQLEDLRPRGFFLGMSVFATLVDYGQPTFPQDAARPKYFTSLSNLGVFIDGSLVLDGPYAAAFSDDAFSIYSHALANFYRDRVIAKDQEFRTIPRLVIRELPDASKLNFAPDIGKDPAALKAGRTVTAAEQPWAFGALLPDPSGPIERGGIKYRAMFPSNHGLKYENGLPVAFDYQAYTKAYPLQTIVTVGGGSSATGTVAVRAGVNLRANLIPLMFQNPPLSDSEFDKAVLGLMEVK